MNALTLMIILLNPAGQRVEIAAWTYPTADACRAAMVATYATPRGQWTLVKASCK